MSKELLTVMYISTELFESPVVKQVTKEELKQSHTTPEIIDNNTFFGPMRHSSVFQGSIAGIFCNGEGQEPCCVTEEGKKRNESLDGVIGDGYLFNHTGKEEDPFSSLTAEQIEYINKYFESIMLD